MYQPKDLSGMKFGKLTAIEPTEKRETNYVVWRCRCDCGNECYVTSKRLQRGTVTNCGCIPKEKNQHGPVPADLAGTVFGSLTVIRQSENIGTRSAWLCRCECGNEITVTTYDLRRGRIKNCGCKDESGPYYIDLIGRQFGYLTVTEKTDSRDYKGSVLWRCKCHCGKEVLYSADALRHGQIKSCGCYREKEIWNKIKDTPHRVEGTCIERLNLQKPRSDNKSGHVGVHKVNENCYRALIGFQGKRYYLGTYSTLDEAINARRNGEKIHTDFLNRYHENQLSGGSE